MKLIEIKKMPGMLRLIIEDVAGEETIIHEIGYDGAIGEFSRQDWEEGWWDDDIMSKLSAEEIQKVLDALDTCTNDNFFNEK